MTTMDIRSLVALTVEVKGGKYLGSGEVKSEDKAEWTKGEVFILKRR